MGWVAIWVSSAAQCSSDHPSPSHLSNILTLRAATSVGAIIGTGIFSTPSSILESVGSIGASLMLWVLGFALSFCGLFVWLELGTMFPRSGGEKVYLEAVYRRPKHLTTVIFAVNAVMLNFSSANCIVSVLSNVSSVLVIQFCSRFSLRSTSLCLCIPIVCDNSNKYPCICRTRC